MPKHTPKIKGEARAARQAKRKRAPKGGTMAGQAKRSETAKGYSGVPKVLKPKIRIKGRRAS